LNETVGGKLLKGVPFSSPCFSNLDGHARTPNLTTCDSVRSGYNDERKSSLPLASESLVEY
jgi:hypothetical protein